MRVCHLRTSERSLSEVKSRPWKLVRQFLPWTSSTRSLTLRNAWSSSFCRSASETSNIRPLRASFAFFRPVVRLTRVLPTLQAHSQSRAIGAAAESYSRTAKVPGALTLYQSFFAKTSVFFLRPFFPFERRLFLPTAMFATLVCWASRWCCRCRRAGSNLQMVDSLNASVVRASDNGGAKQHVTWKPE
jgi:hypothetical protein